MRTCPVQGPRPISEQPGWDTEARGGVCALPACLQLGHQASPARGLRLTPAPCRQPAWAPSVPTAGPGTEQALRGAREPVHHGAPVGSASPESPGSGTDTAFPVECSPKPFGQSTVGDTRSTAVPLPHQLTWLVSPFRCQERGSRRAVSSGPPAPSSLPRRDVAGRSQLNVCHPHG